VPAPYLAFTARSRMEGQVAIKSYPRMDRRNSTGTRMVRVDYRTGDLPSHGGFLTMPTRLHVCLSLISRFAQASNRSSESLQLIVLACTAVLDPDGPTPCDIDHSNYKALQDEAVCATKLWRSDTDYEWLVCRSNMFPFFPPIPYSGTLTTKASKGGRVKLDIGSLGRLSCCADRCMKTISTVSGSPF
jgi:hypothetical protein